MQLTNDRAEPIERQLAENTKSSCQQKIPMAASLIRKLYSHASDSADTRVTGLVTSVVPRVSARIIRVYGM